MEDDNGQSQFVGEFLQFDLPEADTGAVGAAVIGVIVKVWEVE